jgi:hypothetical protein
VSTTLDERSRFTWWVLQGMRCSWFQVDEGSSCFLGIRPGWHVFRSLSGV